MRLAGAISVCSVVSILMSGLASAAPDYGRSDDEKALSDIELLGKRLFEDASLSEPAGVSCSSCHVPNHAFQGSNRSPISAVALGSRPGHLGTRKAPTLMYVSFSPPFGIYDALDDEGRPIRQPEGGQFWDGRAAGLSEQALGPLLNPDEMNNPSEEAVIAKVEASTYSALARAALGQSTLADSKKAMDGLTGALAAYESSERFHPFSSRFDDWLRGKEALTAQEKLGFRLFTDPKKGNCSSCHAGKIDSKDPHDWLFTDFSYSALGSPRNDAIPANADPLRFDVGLCARPGLAGILPKEISLRSLCGQFKTPTLRNVALTGPYFHNGSLPYLRGAVLLYATRDTDAAAWYPKLPTGEPDKFNDLPGGYKANVDTEEAPYDRRAGEKPRLDPDEVDAIVAFLKTLTDGGMW